jgi:superfamily I DNA/RNA helicase/mRNA-degrading endonuclease RelE of RelBE toxin-antitoxin system
MSYLLAMKDTFRADFVRLNRDVQKRASTAMEELEQDPITSRGNTIKKLRHHEKMWRYRIGDYRLVHAAYPDKHLVQLIAIGPRGEIYERLGYQPDAPDYPDFSVAFEGALDPNRETPPEWVQYLTPKESEDESATLPYRLTSELLTAWRIPNEYHKALINCETEDQLLESGVPPEILLHLMNCLWPADAVAVAGSPNLLVGKPDDLARYAAGDLLSFLLLLDDEQKKLGDFSLSGPTLVKGGPGSGKSTVALYRVRTLVESHTQARDKKSRGEVRVLFTTYTNALIEASRQLLDRLLEDGDHGSVKRDVSTLDRIAMQIVSSTHSKPRMAETSDLKYALTSARVASKFQGQNPLEDMLLKRALADLRDDYLLEEFEWIIEGQNLSSLEQYLSVDRAGRGYAFDVRLRRSVWQLYKHSQQFLDHLGKITWGELRKRALARVRSGEYSQRWDYVLVDEAQDLTPVALALALELCREPAGLFMVADACQSLYNRGFAWKNIHESMRVVGRTRILRRNYRTTRQIAEAAASLLRQAGTGDEEALDQFFVQAGPRPKVYAAMDDADLFLWLTKQIQNAARELRLPIGSAAILAPTNDLAQMAARRLSDLGLPTAYMTGRELDLASPSVKAITIHSAKGLEFPILAMPFVEEGFLPRSLPDERAEDLENHLQNELRLLFVGCTRAMRRLFLAYRRSVQSRFLKELHPQLWNLDALS